MTLRGKVRACLTSALTLTLLSLVTAACTVPPTPPTFTPTATPAQAPASAQPSAHFLHQLLPGDVLANVDGDADGNPDPRANSGAHAHAAVNGDSHSLAGIYAYPDILVLWDPALARRMLVHSVEDPARTVNVDALYALGDMSWQYSESFKRLRAQEWFADRLSLEERAFIIVLAKIVGDDALYAGLLEEWHTESASADLPVSVAMGLWAFGHDAVEGDVLAAERVTASPFPVTDIILLQVNAEKYGYGFGGANFRDSMVLSIDSDWDDFSHADLLYREVAHYHLTLEVGPHWLVEGGADFIRVYRKAWDGTEDRDGEVPLFEGNEYAG